MTTYLWAEMVSTDMDGTDDSELLLIPEEVLNEWLPMVAVLKCSTWGEVRALGPAVHQEVLGIAGYGEFADYIANFAVTGEAPGITPGPDAFERFAAQQDAEIPADDQEFDAFSDIPMAADGDWPPSVHLLMAEHLPAEVLQAFATWTRTTFNGDYAHIPLARRGEVLSVLEEMGQFHRHDDRVMDLVWEF